MNLCQLYVIRYLSGNKIWRRLFCNIPKLLVYLTDSGTFISEGFPKHLSLSLNVL